MTIFKKKPVPSTLASTPMGGHPKLISIDSNSRLGSELKEGLAFPKFRVQDVTPDTSFEELDNWYRANGITPPSHNLVKRNSVAELMADYLIDRSRFIRSVKDSKEYKAAHEVKAEA